MSATRTRTVQYRRAVWRQPPPGKISLEKALQDVDKALTDAEHTKLLVETDVWCQLTHRRMGKRAFYVHAAAYIEGQETTTVPHKDANKKNVDLHRVSPPKGEDFTDGEVICRVSGNDVLISFHRFGEQTFIRYLKELMERAGLDEDMRSIDLERSAATDKVEMLKRSPVQEVVLAASLFEETFDQIDEKTQSFKKTLRTRLSHFTKDLLFGIFGNDPTNEELRNADNIRATLTLSYDSRMAGGDVGKTQLRKLAEKAVEVEDGGFSIRTKQGIVTSEELYLKKLVSVPRYADTVSYLGLWDEMDKYHDEIKNSLEK